MSATFLQGDAIDALKKLADGSVHCCVTSPPYWRQRDYEHDRQIGGEKQKKWDYLLSLVEVFREVKRVLRDDGTLWLNIGDTYDKKSPALIPHLLSQGMQHDAGWTLRQSIIWAKPSPMPESVRNRCTRSHEHVLLFTKGGGYYFDPVAIPEFRKDVWTIPSKGYGGAHFAVMPERLAEVCILAGTSDSGCCPHCGTQWVRKVRRTRVPTRPGTSTKATRPAIVQGNRDPLRHVTKVEMLGWEPGCNCELGVASFTPCVVLDPFAGSGTTLAVSEKLGRDSIGIELNPDYIKLAKERVGVTEDAA